MKTEMQDQFREIYLSPAYFFFLMILREETYIFGPSLDKPALVLLYLSSF